MTHWRSVCSFGRTIAEALLIALLAPVVGYAGTITVARGGDLQAALNAARPGDTILLEPGATFVGNFVLPVHGGTTYVTLRSGADDKLLPRDGMRMSPAYSQYLPKIKSPNTMAAMKTAPGAAYWRLMFLELMANVNGASDILQLGDGSAAQNTLSLVPHDLIVDRVYMHGDRLNGQKRGIALNSGNTAIVNSHISECKAVTQDSQAIGGWNGPGPYRIENNYLEGAGEVFMLGGDDPKFPTSYRLIFCSVATPLRGRFRGASPSFRLRPPCLPCRPPEISRLARMRTASLRGVRPGRRPPPRCQRVKSP
jgi:hypothetical protein